MPEFNIRKATNDDAERIVSFITSLAEHEKTADETAPVVERLRAHMQPQSPWRIRGLIADIPERSVGYCLWMFGYDTNKTRPIIELKDLFVEKGLRRRGIATQMYERLLQEGRQHGCEHISLQIMHNNPSALGFYEKLGFEVELRMQTLYLPCR